jgi:hypothetical protein
MLSIFLPQLEDKGTGEMRILKIAVCNRNFLNVALDQTIHVGEVQRAEQNGYGDVMSAIKHQPRSFLFSCSFKIVNGCGQQSVRKSFDLLLSVQIDDVKSCNTCEF